MHPAGYSLDGLAPVDGGLQKNLLFDIACKAGVWQSFDGECKSYAHVASTEIVYAYNKVFEILWGEGGKAVCMGLNSQVFRRLFDCASIAY